MFHFITLACPFRRYMACTCACTLNQTVFWQSDIYIICHSCKLTLSLLATSKLTSPTSVPLSCVTLSLFMPDLRLTVTQSVYHYLYLKNSCLVIMLLSAIDIDTLCHSERCWIFFCPCLCPCPQSFRASKFSKFLRYL